MRTSILVMNPALFAAGVGTAVGFLLRSLWDAYVKRRAELEGKRLQLIERRLSEFYWPVFIRLQKDNAVWAQMRWRASADPIEKQVAFQIEEHIVIPNHKEVVQIIQDKIHLVEADRELNEQLLAFIRHVAVFDALRRANIQDRDPIALGERYPTELFHLMEIRTAALQERYDGELRTAVESLKTFPLTLRVKKIFSRMERPSIPAISTSNAVVSAVNIESSHFTMLSDEGLTNSSATHTTETNTTSLAFSMPPDEDADQSKTQ